ncbi:uncharacterized protein A1O5_12218 [Cladophialophora psammophila CBS 110553]|uniref:Uncharacterized protein n=1 Tax=Cladophialophora psammophila CBS 110553 TaxID=1182543 RepID=W9VUF9_9EURO|nr:uncharacterized protein A1O5_12218 [Cladophialophora psammophila CBS 110553]EXJ59337.1 hypothetical protein A1O5_12218 [Cladophialophora psammophila CBS 110553]
MSTEEVSHLFLHIDDSKSVTRATYFFSPSMSSPTAVSQEGSVSKDQEEQVGERASESEQPRGPQNPRTQRPVPEEKAAGDTGTRYSKAQRVQTLTLLSLGWTPRQVEDMIKVPAPQARRIFRKAKERGYCPREDPRILDHYVEDGLITGRPKKTTQTPSEVEQRLVNLVVEDTPGREKSSDVPAYGTGVKTVHQSILRLPSPT